MVGKASTGMSRRTDHAGFSLVEVVLAFGICAFCLAVLVGLLSTGLRISQDAVSQTEASGIARMIAADLLVTRDDQGIALTRSPRFRIVVADGSAKVSAPALYFTEGGVWQEEGKTAASKFQAVVTFGVSPAGGEGIPVHLLVSWPAGVTPPLGVFEAVTQLEP